MQTTHQKQPTMKLTWPEKLAVINHFSLAQDRAATVFGNTSAEIGAAIAMRDSGQMQAATGLDMTKFSYLMSSDAPSADAGSVATTHARTPQKRGRKGTKIAIALKNVPLMAQPINEFIATHNVSLAVLRQSKRFIKGLTAEDQAAIGNIIVRKDRDRDVLMIWREMPEPKTTATA